MPTRTLRGDALRIARELFWNHAMQDALDETGCITHGDQRHDGGSAALWRAVRLQDAIGWPHEPFAPLVTLDDVQAATLRLVLVEAIEAYGESAAGASFTADADYARGQLRNATRVLGAVSPAA